MDKVFLSKSSYCDCLQCEKIYWMKKHKKQEASAEANDSALSRGKVVGEFAKGLFKNHVDVAADEDINLRVQKTEKPWREKLWKNRFLQSPSVVVAVRKVPETRRLSNVSFLNKPVKNEAEVVQRVQRIISITNK